MIKDAACAEATASAAAGARAAAVMETALPISRALSFFWEAQQMAGSVHLEGEPSIISFRH